MAEGDPNMLTAQQEEKSSPASSLNTAADVATAPQSSSAAPALREDQIQNAVSFLSHPKVKHTSRHTSSVTGTLLSLAVGQPGRNCFFAEVLHTLSWHVGHFRSKAKWFVISPLFLGLLCSIVCSALHHSALRMRELQVFLMGSGATLR